MSEKPARKSTDRMPQSVSFGNTIQSTYYESEWATRKGFVQSRINAFNEVAAKTAPPSSAKRKMEVGVAYPQGGAVPTGSPDRGARNSPRSNLHVEFAQVGEMKERKEKYLTAKYGAHQMSLIRKRLGVEMWMYDQLQALYQSTIKDGKYEEKEIDLDELLDIEDDAARRKFLQKELADCKQSSDIMEKFTAELLERAKTL